MTQNSKDLSMLETERLLLSNPSKDAIPDVIKNLNDLEVSKWLAVVPYPYTQADAIWYIDHCADKRKQQSMEDYDYWIKLKDTRETIGGIGLSDIDWRTKTGTIGYWIGTAHHGNGYGSEALKRVLDLVFKELELETINAAVFVGNPSSGKLLEKFGAKRPERCEKTHHCKATGLEHNIFEYTLAKEDYAKSRGCCG